jgi:hypothetical protein
MQINENRQYLSLEAAKELDFLASKVKKKLSP